MRNSIMWLVAMGLVSMNVQSAEMGRTDVKQNSVPVVQPGENIPVVKAYQGNFIDQGLAVQVAVTWNSMSWKAGDYSFSGDAWAPQASIIYGADAGKDFSYDIRFTGKVMQLKGTDTKDNDTITGDADFVRLGFGSRLWFNRNSDLIPFAGLGLNYSLPSMKDSSIFGNESGMFGISAEAGIAYVMTDNLAIEFGILGETSLNKGSVDITKSGTTSSKDLSCSGFGLAVGLTVLL